MLIKPSFRQYFELIISAFTWRRGCEPIAQWASTSNSLLVPSLFMLFCDLYYSLLPCTYILNNLLCFPFSTFSAMSLSPFFCFQLYPKVLKRRVLMGWMAPIKKSRVCSPWHTCWALEIFSLTERKKTELWHIILSCTWAKHAGEASMG